MRMGLIKPDFKNEARVALLPEHMQNLENELVIDKRFGETMGIPSEAYAERGAQIAGKDEIFATCDAIFSLKIIQEHDFPKIRKGQTIFGWVHPYDSIAQPLMKLAKEKDLTIIDFDNIHPAIYYREKVFKIPFLSSNFIWKNSFWAGCASVQHALINYGMVPDSKTKVAILSPGNTAQGAYWTICKYPCEVRLFYRKTIHEFLAMIQEFDIIINGVEILKPGKHIISRKDLKRTKPGCLFIDSAANADGAIAGTRYTSIEDPLYWENGRCFYEVDNVPSIYFRTVSKYMSEVWTQHIFRPDIRRYYDVLRDAGESVSDS